MIYVSMIRTVALQSYAAALVFARSAHGNLYTDDDGQKRRSEPYTN
ncbi:hypothetical protein [Pseudoalteromonas piscicida]